MAEATIYDVAKRAGVAISTVSKVLSGRHAVSSKTKKRVLKAVRELNYIPSSAARTLAGEPTNLVGVLVSQDMPHLAALLHGIDLEMRRRQGGMLVAVAYTVDEQAQAILRLVRGLRVDALLLVGDESSMRGLLDELALRCIIIPPDFAADAAENVGKQAARTVFGTPG